jgi:tetratricopeptide (TPR) repeat protein
VAWSGVAVSLVFFLHRLAGWQRVFELYSPVYAPTSPLSAPLLNANHLSGYLGLSAAVAVGLAFNEKERIRRLLLIFAAGFTGGAVFLTLSRGGILCFVGGQLLFMAVRVITRLREKSRRRRQELRLLPLALAVGLGSGIYVAYQSVLKEFLYGDTSKLDIPADALPMLRDFWLTGVGRGAFQVGYTMYQKLPDGSTYTSPENFVAQFLTEWGAVAGGALLVMLLGALLLGLLKPPGRSRNVGALAAIFALTVQNFVDFSLEILGVLLPFMVLLASHWVTLENAFGIAHRSGKGSKGFTNRYVPGIAGAVVVVAALVLAAAGFLQTSRSSLEKETEEVKGMLARDVGEEKFVAEARSVMKRHPADYYFPLLAGARIYHGMTRNPLPYLSRALFLFPNSSAAHLYVARTLGRSGHVSQALLEYMHAVRSNASMVAGVAREVAAFTGTFEGASKMTRTDEDRILMYGALSLAFRAAGLEGESEAADAALLKIDPFDAGAAERTVGRMIGRGEYDAALKTLKILESEEGLRPLALELEGDLESKKGNVEKAAALFVEAWKRAPERRHLLSKAARLYSMKGEKKLMYKYLSEYEASAPDERSKGYAIAERASFEQSLNMTDKALASYHAAAAYIPDEPGVWQAIASLSASRKDAAGQLKAYKELRRIQPENPEWQKRIDDIQNRLNATVLDGSPGTL